MSGQPAPGALEKVSQKIEEMRAAIAENGFYILTASRHSDRNFILTHTRFSYPFLLTVTTTGYSVEGEHYDWIGKTAKECLRHLDCELTRRNKG